MPIFPMERLSSSSGAMFKLKMSQFPNLFSPSSASRKTPNPFKFINLVSTDHFGNKKLPRIIPFPVCFIRNPIQLDPLSQILSGELAWRR